MKGSAERRWKETEVTAGSFKQGINHFDSRSVPTHALLCAAVFVSLWGLNSLHFDDVFNDFLFPFPICLLSIIPYSDVMCKQRSLPWNNEAVGSLLV